MRSKSYTQTTIYQIKVGDDKYIGHTTNLTNRKRTHRHTSAVKPDILLYKKVSQIGWDNCVWSVLEVVECSGLKDARQHEQKWIRNIQPSLNALMPNRTQREYQIENKDKINEWRRGWEKEYNQREHVKEYKTEYNKNYSKSEKGLAHQHKINDERKSRRFSIKLFSELPFFI